MKNITEDVNKAVAFFIRDGATIRGLFAEALLASGDAGIEVLNNLIEKYKLEIEK